MSNNEQRILATERYYDRDISKNEQNGGEIISSGVPGSGLLYTIGPTCSETWRLTTDSREAPASLRSGCADSAGGLLEYQVQCRRIHGQRVAGTFV